jgi:hypothetical protein
MPSYSLHPVGLLILMAPALAIIVTGLTYYQGLPWYIGLALSYGGLALAQFAFLGLRFSGVGRVGGLREATEYGSAARSAVGHDRV